MSMAHRLNRVVTPGGQQVTRPDDWVAPSRSAMAEWVEAWRKGMLQAKRTARASARNTARRLWLDRDRRELESAGFWGAVCG